MGARRDGLDKSPFYEMNLTKYGLHEWSPFSDQSNGANKILAMVRELCIAIEIDS